jgi:hypothetical protein
MSDKKPIYSVSDEVHKAAHAMTVSHEERSKTIYRLKMVGCSHSDAMEIALAECDRNQAVQMFENGKTKYEIIDFLKKG